MVKYKNAVLYTIILVLISTLLFTQKIIYVRVINNAIIFGINIESPKEVIEDNSIWGGIDRKALDKQIAESDTAIKEADIIIADARKRGFI